MSPSRVLIVDDSAFARKVLREILSTSSALQIVGTARDGLDALEKISQLRPDVVTLDLVMPGLDGVGVLNALPKNGAPRVVVVTMADEDSALGITALQAGAVDIVHKPTALAVARLYELQDELVRKVEAAATARSIGAVPRPSIPSPPLMPTTATSRLLVIGASTGGPQALTRIVRELPQNFPVPVAIALHMPPGYTEAFARRLDQESAADVLEAHDDVELVPGRVVVARAGMHLKVEARNGTLRGRLDFLPLDRAHRPSVDVLFESAATAVGARLLAVVLTGMGDDGTRGAGVIRGAGGKVVVEAESSCVVYGMPRSVKAAGHADAEVPLDEMLAEIVRRA